MCSRNNAKNLPDELGFYKVESLFQQGAMGELFLCRDKSLGRKTVVKRLKKPLRGSKDMETRFTREVQVLSSLKHPVFPATYFFWKQDHALHLAMEFVDGENLRNILDRRGRFSWQEALSFLQEVLPGLATAHHADIVHRDIKPSNLMIDTGGQVKLLDFGIARQVEDQELTMPGTLIGTGAYMSPEQARGADANARSDIFSLGILLFEALAGTHPFRATEPADTLENIQHREPDWNLLHGHAPRAFIAILRCMLKKNRQERPAEAKTLLDVLFRSSLPRFVNRHEILAATLDNREIPAQLAGSRRWPKKLAWILFLLASGIGAGSYLAPWLKKIWSSWIF